MSVLVVGSVAFDSIKTPFGNAPDILGGSASYFSIAAGFFTQVRLVAVVGDDFGDEHIQVFTSKAVDIRGLEKVPGKTFHWAGEYARNMNYRTTLDTQLNVFADFSPKIPSDYSQSEYLFLGNIDPALQWKVLQQVTKPRLVACDTMNYWISGHRSALLHTLKYIDILIINDQETCELAEEESLNLAIPRVLSLGPRILVIKRGEHGVFVVAPGLKFFVPAFPVEEVKDPTGAGDTFAGGFMGYLAGARDHSLEHLKKATVCGSVMASFCVEKFGLMRLLELTFPEITARFKEFQRMTQFQDL